MNYTLLLIFCWAAVVLAEVLISNQQYGSDLTPISAARKSTHKVSWSPVSSQRTVPALGAVPDAPLEIVDVVLVASVDGKFHALNRTSGQVLWSMSSNTPSTSIPNNSSANLPPSLRPLVRTDHVSPDSDAIDDEDAPPQEIYIIEPQSGEIFVMNTPNSPLERLPFTMIQLIDMSPFSFAGDEDRRVFVGRKETTLMLIDLQTGVLKEINSERPWDLPNSTTKRRPRDWDLDDLEETLEGSPEEPTEVYIGRTDYHLAIHTRPTDPRAPKPAVQNLMFSTYGPNNKYAAAQSAYHRSADDVYVQPLPSGVVLSFKAPPRGNVQADNLRLVWQNRFKSPVVATFDVVRTAGKGDPFVLLQPRPHFDENYFYINQLPNRHSGHIGLIDDSLFAMSANQFPLVAFDRSDEAAVDYPSIDAMTKARRDAKELQQLCKEKGNRDIRCLLGLRPLDQSGRTNRLIEGVPSVPTSTPLPQPTTFDNSSIKAPYIVGVVTAPVVELARRSNVGVLISTIFASIAGLFWYTRTRNTPAVISAPPIQIESKATISSKVNATKEEEKSLLVRDAYNIHQNGLPTPPPSESAGSDINVSPDTPNLNGKEGATGKDTQAEDDLDADDSDKDGDEANQGRKKGPKRRKRGKKKKTLQLAEPVQPAEIIDENEDEKWRSAVAATPVAAALRPGTPQLSALVLPPTPKSDPVVSQLIVSEHVLGFGSHGTVVYSGSLQGRAVAVKRLLQDFVTLASREVSILQDADDHPNVIRYYYQEAHANFLYIALELCPASLADVIERPDQYAEISVTFEPKRALKQITAGLRHLHGLKIVHRDIKPQNILISAGPSHRMLISDFGLCKKLEVDQTSFLPTAAEAGTVGWRAPEIMRGDVKLDEGINEENQHSRGSSTGGTGTATKRLTKLVDIFALGCLFYYTLTNGGHPFGDRYEREINILKGAKPCLEGIGFDRFGEEGAEASALIESMLALEPTERPDTTSCLLHPFFWDSTRRLAFLQDASDRFEIMCRDPRDPYLIQLEIGARDVVGPDWHTRLDRVFVENLGKFRKYDGKSVQDLMRALRNKKHHYQDLPDNVKRHLGPMPEGFLAYFTRRFPRLFLHVYGVISSSALQQEAMFRSYFSLSDS